MRAPRRASYCLLLASIVCNPLATLRADDRTAADLLPASTLAYAEVPRPGELMDVLQSHPLRQRLEGLDGIRRGYESKQYLEFKAVVAIVEARLGQTWPRLLAVTTTGGLSLGYDADTQGAALLAKAQDAETIPQLIQSLVELARADAQTRNRPDPVKSGEHRGITAWQLDQARIAAFGPWLLVTNNAELGERVLDQYLDRGEETLAAVESFQQARTSMHDAAVWGYLHVAELRRRGGAKELFTGRTDNPLAELLVGGLLDTLKETPYAAARLDVAPQQARLELVSPHQTDWVSQPREYFFGPNGTGAAPALLTAEERLLAVSAYRDLSRMWLQAGDLYQEKMVDQLAQAESNLSTLFSGKDFGEEVLGAVGPEVQLVVCRQRFEATQPQPAIKLPAFAAAFRLKDPATMQPELRRTFQSLIGFLNVVGAMNGQPQLDLDIERKGESQLISASYLAEATQPAGGLKIHYNFSPSVGFVADRFVVASTKALAHELLGVMQQEPPAAKPVNATAQADVAAVRELLADNRGQLIAQNMLSEGHTKEEAERAIDDLLAVVAAVQTIGLDLRTADQQLRLALEFTFAE